MATRVGLGSLFGCWPAVITVPLAEETRFPRLFLMRRLISPDFESVSLRRFSLVCAPGPSSIIFRPSLTGDWLEGIIAGILFGLVTIRRGRIGDGGGCARHGQRTFAVFVSTYHKWHLW